MDFVGSKDIEAQRKIITEARQSALNKAQRDYEKRQKRLLKEKQSGKGVWILPSLSEKIERDTRTLQDASAPAATDEKMKKKKKRSKEKKKKKDKKKKKEVRRNGSSCSGSSEGEDEWTEKQLPSDRTDGSVGAAASAAKNAEVAVATSAVKRDEWMTMEQDLVPCTTRAELREKIRQDKDRCQREIEAIEQPGLHARELNPYWKDGGTGLPADSGSSADGKGSGQHPSVGGDGGLAWYRAAYERCVKMAAVEKKSLEEVAAARWGSLEKLETLLMEAERAAERKLERDQDDERRRPRQRASTDRHRESPSPEVCMKKKRHRSRSTSSSSSASRSPQRHIFPKKAVPELQSVKEPRGRLDKYGHSRSEGQRHQRRRTRSRSRSLSPDWRLSQSHRRDVRPSEKRSAFLKPCADDEHSVRTDGGAYDKRSEQRSAFLKPLADDGGGSINVSRTRDSMSPTASSERPGGRMAYGQSSATPSWRKAGCTADCVKTRPSESSQSSRASEKDSRSSLKDTRSPCKDDPSTRDSDRKLRDRARSSSSSSVTSACSDTASETDTENAVAAEAEPIAEVLTEAQMNDLGAAILRAELSGDDEEAALLKARLEKARRLREEGGVSTSKSEVIVLSRVDHQGKVYPAAVSSASAQSGRAVKGRRRATKGKTHDSSGQRQRYFQDDDKFDLRALVQNERFTSAEDQNSMFRKNVSAASQRTDDDFQVDDIFLQKAMYHHSNDKLEQKQRALAQAQSRRFASALEGCHRCFDTCVKHLVVAIGDKVYLALPDHEGLCEGHCLIVPMQHAASATAVDEDVYAEMQLFRRALVKMFSAAGEDCVFMECSLNLKRLPHTIIECVPLPAELGDVAPIYFKKAIMESESEWAQNKKLVDLSKSDIRRSIPKGFPYFAVDFGLQNGFAHVVENESTFPSYFGKEVVGGMLDAEPRLWRKPAREDFEVQRQKVLSFADKWKPFDITAKFRLDPGGAEG